MSRMKEVNDIQNLMEKIIIDNAKLLELSKSITDKELSRRINSYCSGIIMLTQNINTYIFKRIADMYESDKIDINFEDIIKDVKKEDEDTDSRKE